MARNYLSCKKNEESGGKQGWAMGTYEAANRLTYSTIPNPFFLPRT